MSGCTSLPTKDDIAVVLRSVDHPVNVLVGLSKHLAAHISWRPDYNRFFYDQLLERARRIYLFRGEYIFDLEKTVVVETPQLGHAT